MHSDRRLVTLHSKLMSQYLSTQKKKAVQSSEKLNSFYQTVCCHR